MEEIWKDVVGYEGLYQVSNLGRVKSLPNVVCKKERILQQRISSNGYYEVRLTKNKKRKPHTVHRLVATAFIPNPDNLPQVGHKDENNFRKGDGCNNCVDNLEWCTAKENCNMPKHCQRKSEANKGKVLSEETRRKLSESNKGNYGEKNPMYGRKHSYESRKKMSITKSIPVICVETGIIYYGATEAQRQTTINQSSIVKCCKGKQNTAKGFHWKYYNEEKEDNNEST